eukprot:gene3100-5270_t
MFLSSTSVSVQEENMAFANKIKSRRTFMTIKQESELTSEMSPEKREMVRRYKNMKLSEILSDKKKKEVFKNFSEKELIFKDENQRYLELEKIYHKFLSPDSELQLNIRIENVHRIGEIVKDKSEIPEDVLEDIVREVKETLKDTYARFKESKEFEDLL